MRARPRLGRAVYHSPRRFATVLAAGATTVAPFLVAAALLAACAVRISQLAGINGTSPGGRYADPLAPASRDFGADEAGDGDPELGILPTYEWVPASREGWAYRNLLSRLGVAASGPRMDLQVVGEARYGRESYPIVVVSVGAATPKAKVLLTAGVHGNETAGPEALARFVELMARPGRLYPDVAFDIVAVVNPWGWAHDSRFNGAGKDVNRDFGSSQTQEAAVIRRFVAARIRRDGRYDVALDLHESTKPGYFVYQYVPRRAGLGSTFARAVQLAGGGLEESYREAGFRVKGGVLTIPALALPYVSLLGRLSLEQHLRLKGTRHAYTLESPLGDAFQDRVRIHGEAVRAMLNSYLRRRGIGSQSAIAPAR